MAVMTPTRTLIQPILPLAFHEWPRPMGNFGKSSEIDFFDLYRPPVPATTSERPRPARNRPDHPKARNAESGPVLRDFLGLVQPLARPEIKTGSMSNTRPRD